MSWQVHKRKIYLYSRNFEAQWSDNDMHCKEQQNFDFGELFRKHRIHEVKIG